MVWEMWFGIFVGGIAWPPVVAAFLSLSPCWVVLLVLPLLWVVLPACHLLLLPPPPLEMAFWGGEGLVNGNNSWENWDLHNC